MNALTQFAEAQPVTLVSAEIDLQISTAKRFPRSMEAFRKSAMAMATLNESVAQQCLYALPRDGKTIEGPSARLAEILVAAWGNCRAAARIVAEEREFIVAQGVFLDLETNAATTKEVRRRIVDKQGRRFTLDMVGVTGNAASSIALRNAILGGIPRALWADVYENARRVVIGDVKTLAQRRANALEAFKPYGIVEAQVFEAIGVAGRNDIGPDELLKLAGWLNAIKEGEVDPEEVFKPVPKAAPAKPAPAPADKLQQFAAGETAGTGRSTAPETSSPAPAAFDQTLAEARVKAICEALGSARSQKTINQIKRDAIAFLALLDEHWGEGKDQITAALAAAEESIPASNGKRDAPADGESLGGASRTNSTERT
jgi:hypothetical protein